MVMVIVPTRSRFAIMPRGVHVTVLLSGVPPLLLARAAGGVSTHAREKQHTSPTSLSTAEGTIPLPKTTCAAKRGRHPSVMAARVMQYLEKDKNDVAVFASIYTS
jgi:hypothetical protein